MKLVNTSSKVVSIGSIVLMPDESMDIGKEIAELPSVKVFVRKGFLKIDDSAEMVEEIAAKAKAEAEAEAKAKAEKEATEKAEAKKKPEAEAKTKVAAGGK